MIGPNAIKLAVFGQPVAPSLSPRIHHLFGEQLGLDVDYGAIESGIDELAERLAAFRADGGTGANLTVPLKASGLALCSHVDPAASQAGAVNTLKLENDGWHGFNTDGAGLMLDLERLDLDVAGRNVLIVGAGGSAAGILEPLLAAAPARVCLINRTLDRAERLAEKFARFGPVTAAALTDGPGKNGFDLLIQSTSAGHAGEVLPIERSWLRERARAYDLNYGRAHRPFSRWCRINALPVHEGIGMLIGQAALAFEIWTGHRPSIVKAITKIKETGD